MENFTLQELRVINSAMIKLRAAIPRGVNGLGRRRYDELIDKIRQAIDDKEFEDKTRPLKF